MNLCLSLVCERGTFDGWQAVASDNVEGLTPLDIVTHYKSLADLERGFKVVKSMIGIGQIYHLLPERIRAHARNLAARIYRIIRLKVSNLGSPHSLKLNK